MPGSTYLREFITNAIRRSGRSPDEIAAEAGLSPPGVLRKFLDGRARLPAAQGPELAGALGVNSLALMRLIMEEDYTEVWTTIRDCGHEFLTPAEIDLVNMFRDATREEFDDAFDEVEAEMLNALFAEIASRRGIGR